MASSRTECEARQADEPINRTPESSVAPGASSAFGTPSAFGLECEISISGAQGAGETSLNAASISLGEQGVMLDVSIAPMRPAYQARQLSQGTAFLPPACAPWPHLDPDFDQTVSEDSSSDFSAIDWTFLRPFAPSCPSFLSAPACASEHFGAFEGILAPAQPAAIPAPAQFVGVPQAQPAAVSQAQPVVVPQVQPTTIASPAEPPAAPAEPPATPADEASDSPQPAAPKKKSPLGDIIFYALLIALVVGAFFISGGAGGGPKMIAGYSAFTVTTGSMHDVLPQGSLIVTQHVEPETLQVGDDITYMISETSSITHRIIDIEPNHPETGGLAFKTQGTMNDDPDKNLVPAVNVVGKVIFCSYPLGVAVGFVQDNWPLLIFLAVVAAVLFSVLRRILR